MNDAPNAPTSGFSPAGGTIVNVRRPTISWDAGTDPNATDPPSTLSYQLEFSAAYPPFTVAGAYTATTAAGVTNAQPAADLPDGMWYYRVITIDNDAAQSAGSAVQNITVLNEDPTWTGVSAGQFSPTGEITTTTPLLAGRRARTPTTPPTP